MAWLSDNPDKRFTERLVLFYSPIWMAVIALLVITKRFARWGDIGDFTLGLALAAPILLLPVLAPAPGEARRPLLARHGARFAIAVTITSFVQNLLGASLFFEQLGMEYHFPVRWILRGTPLFLYFLTVAYFATYYVLLQIALRPFQRNPRFHWLARALFGYCVAFAETYSMATRALSPYFLYSKPRFALLIGSACYGTLFLVTVPLFERLDERATGDPPLRELLRDLLAANLLALLLYEAYGVLFRAFLH